MNGHPRAERDSAHQSDADTASPQHSTRRQEHPQGGEETGADRNSEVQAAPEDDEYEPL